MVRATKTLETTALCSLSIFKFRLLEVRGDQLTHLDMRNVDELNLNAILLVIFHSLFIFIPFIHSSIATIYSI